MQASSVNTLTSAGAVRTVLDDGSGNMTTNSTSTGNSRIASFLAPNMVGTGAFTTVSLGRDYSQQNLANLVYTYGGSTGSTSSALSFQLGGITPYGLTLNGANKLSSAYNVLDDGNGNFTAGGNIACTGQLNINGTTVAGTGGIALSVPVSSGQIGLRPQYIAFGTTSITVTSGNLNFTGPLGFYGMGYTSSTISL